jgi:hypothetical protein
MIPEQLEKLFQAWRELGLKLQDGSWYERRI